MRALDSARFLLGAIAATLVLTSTPCVAAELSARLDIQFTGSSTLHDFHGTAAPVTVTIKPDPNAAARWIADVAVPIATLDTGNGTRDEKMRAMLDAVHFPVIRGMLRDIDPAAVRTSGRLPFVLAIGDVEHAMSAAINDWQESDDEVRFDASFDVSLKAFDLEAPRVLFLRVADRVRVKMHATVRRSESSVGTSTRGERS